MLIALQESKIKDWYNRKYCEKGISFCRPPEAYEVYLNYLKAESGKRLLDVGCGTGNLFKAANKRGLKTYGVDLSDEAVRIAQQNYPSSKITVGSGTWLNLPDGFFDYVTCLGALEHFLDMEKSITEMVRVGRDDAIFCIVVPNVNYFYDKFTGEKGTEQQEINERLLSLSEWKKKFSGQFEILKIYQDTWPFRNRKVFQPADPFKIIVKTILRYAYFLIPLNYTYVFIFIMKKRLDAKVERVLKSEL